MCVCAHARARVYILACVVVWASTRMCAYIHARVHGSSVGCLNQQIKTLHITHSLTYQLSLNDSLSHSFNLRVQQLFSLNTIQVVTTEENLSFIP